MNGQYPGSTCVRPPGRRFPRWTPECREWSGHGSMKSMRRPMKPSSLWNRRCISPPFRLRISFTAMRSVQLFLLASLAACAGSTHPAPPSSPPSPAQPAGHPNESTAATPAGHAPALPPVPLVEGPLAPKVVYPQAGAVIASRDSNFIFGSLGNGHASLTINGVPVPVLANGSFLAYLALPPRNAPHYELVATLGKDTVRVVQPVTLLPPRPVLSDTGRLVVDSASVSPAGGLLVLRPDDPVHVSVRAPANASAWVKWDSVGAMMQPA